MVLVVFLIISFAVTLVFTVIFGLVGMDVGPDGTGGSLLAVISGIVSAAGTTVFTLMSVTIYRQLTGTDTPEVFS